MKSINIIQSTLLAAFMLFAAFQAKAQEDSTASEPFVIDSKFFKFQFYDKGSMIDSNSRRKIEKTLKEVEEELVELEEDLEEEGIDLKEEFSKHLGKPKKPKLVETKAFVMDLGLNNFINNGSLEMPADYQEMNLDKLRSVNFHLGIIQQGINLYQGKLRLVYGAGIEYNNYRFTDNIDLVKNSKPLAYTVNSDLDYKKNKLVSQYLTLPLMLNFKSNPRDEDKSLRVSAGVQFGYLIGSHIKQKWEDGKDSEKRKIRGDYQFADYRTGYVVQFGYGGFNLYGKYYPNSAFKADRGPEVSTASLGIVLTPF